MLRKLRTTVLAGCEGREVAKLGHEGLEKMWVGLLGLFRRR